VINRVKALFVERRGAPLVREAGHSHEELRIAAAALMVEAAQLDDTFDARERDKIRELVAERFELDAEEGDSLIEAAEARVAESSQIHGFTRVIKARFSHEERIELVEMLWEVVYADGELHHYEANLMRRLAGLLQVSDREAGAARKRARERLDNSGARTN
jgi:uncharacterized tellurite resistance protein B-like protein